MTKMPEPVAGSFRDPSGFVFVYEGRILRQVNHVYQAAYDLLMESGLYTRLVEKGLLLPHEEVDLSQALTGEAYKVIAPLPVPFISYPYEWSFSQLRDAALLTLRIQKTALRYGMSLKDCSAYNVQFMGGKPVFIDTLSFEPYREGAPWTAYRQFCQHFLAPLALMAYGDVRLSQLLRIYLDGVPLDLASRLLPPRTYLNGPLLVNLHLHARAQRRYADTDNTHAASRGEVGRTALLGMLDSLRAGVTRLHWKPLGTEWADYYQDTNYTDEALKCKEALVTRFLELVQPGMVWDLGANTGHFSRLASARTAQTVAFDVDPAAVERNYLHSVAEHEVNMLPLVLDLTNPSPGLGWANCERPALAERGPVDLVMALALVHHLAISNNVPLERVAQFFSVLGDWLVIEFVPKDDSQVQRLLAHREDIFPGYTEAGFEAAFAHCFDIQHKEAILGSHRVLYLMRAFR